MPILQYLLGVGGALLCLMFTLNAYVPAAPPRDQHEVDKSIIHVTAAPTGDFVIDHLPAVRGDLADANDAVKRAMAMMPPEDARQAASNKRAHKPAAATPPAPRKRRLVRRPRSPPWPVATCLRPRPYDVLEPGFVEQRLVEQQVTGPATGHSGWSNNSGNWNGNWSHGWGGNSWVDNQGR